MSAARSRSPTPLVRQIFGLFDSGAADIAREKDRYVDAAVSANRQDDARD